MPSAVISRSSLNLENQTLSTPTGAALRQVVRIIARFEIWSQEEGLINLTIPKGSSVLDFVKEGHALAPRLRGLDVISPSLLKEIHKEERFIRKCGSKRSLKIQGFVPHSTKLSHSDQQALLRSKTLLEPTREELVAAFIAGFLITGKSIFQFNSIQRNAIRSKQGTFFYGNGGLFEDTEDSGKASPLIGIAGVYPRQL